MTSIPSPTSDGLYHLTIYNSPSPVEKARQEAEDIMPFLAALDDAALLSQFDDVIYGEPDPPDFVFITQPSHRKPEFSQNHGQQNHFRMKKGRPRGMF